MNVAALRLHHQQIAGSRLGTPEQVVAWLGGLQGQDYPGAKWSVGLRLPAATDAEVQRAIDTGRIVRTWPMRGTLHLVAAEDVRWMLALTSPGNLKGSAARRRQLELDDTTLARCRDVFIRALAGGRQKRRDELYAALEEAGITTAGQRGYHLLWNAALHGLICFAAMAGREQAFALQDEWIPPTRPRSRDEALAELALRYFTSRGPATIHDFAWWSGLGVTEAQAGLEAVKAHLVRETLDGRACWLSPDVDVPEGLPRAFALPGFDEYLLGYKDRGAVLAAADADKVCPGANGVFAPTMVLDGRVVGTWKRTLRRASVDITPQPFIGLDEDGSEAFDRAARRYAAFLGLPATVSCAPGGPVQPGGE